MDRTRAARPHRGGDDGFTLVEVLVAVAIIAVVMLGLGAVFVASAAGTDQQGQRQAAVRLATGGLDRVRSLAGPEVARGRTTAAVTSQWNARPAGVRTLLAGLTPATDDTAGRTASLPTTAESVVVDGLTYTRSWYVARCALTTANTCVASATTGTVPMYDVVVSIGWTSKECAAARCSYELSTLVDAGSVDPVFDANEAAPAPVIASIADIVQDVTEPVTGPVLAAAGGSGTLTYASTDLPGGVRLTGGALTGTLDTPTATGGKTVTVTVSDQFGQSSSTTFTWTVNPLPALTAATVPVTVGTALTPVDLGSALKLTGGTAPYTWSCGTLPAGLTLSGGTLTGVVAAVGTVRLSCGVTDARSKTATGVLTLSVLPKLVVATPVNGTTTAVSRAAGVNLVATATGCSVACTWAATGVPVGVTLNTVTGQLSGRPTTPGRYTVTLTATDLALRTATSTVTWVVA